MMTGAVRPRPSSKRIRATLAAAGCALATFSLLCTAFCWIGASYEGQLRLLEPYRLPTVDEAIGLIPIEYALTENEANDVIFIGGSTCRSGLDPRRFENLTGLTAYNLGSFASLSILGQLATLNAYLEHHPTPRAVVLCVSPVEILRVQADPDVPGGTTAGTLYERFLRVYGPPSQRRGVLADGNDSLRYFINRGMAITKASCTACLDGQTPDRLSDPLYGFGAETYKTLRNKMRESRGFSPLPKEHGAGVLILQTLEEPHSVLPWINDGVRSFAALAQSHSFQLIIRLGPLSSTQAPWDHECIPAWLKQLEAEFPRVSVSRPEILWYEPSVCWDSVHVNASGVERFTAHTAKDVTSLVGSRQTTSARSERIDKDLRRR
jgi:hypothetical protein